jgi:hypothetical protein
LYRRLGGPSAGLDFEAKGKNFLIFLGSKLDRPVVQPVARHYTDSYPRLYLVYTALKLLIHSIP